MLTSSNAAYWETNSSEAPQELNEPLVRIGREVERHGRAAKVYPFAVGWYGVRFPGDFNILFEVTVVTENLIRGRWCGAVHGEFQLKVKFRGSGAATIAECAI